MHVSVTIDQLNELQATIERLRRENAELQATIGRQVQVQMMKKLPDDVVRLVNEFVYGDDAYFKQCKDRTMHQLKMMILTADFMNWLEESGDDDEDIVRWVAVRIQLKSR